MSKPRVRFAPSPTGVLHLGNARTALFNYLFAKKENGTFILRIEDTDRERSTEEAVQIILAGLEWLGLGWDEGPFFQSERTELYVEAVEKLLETGGAYRCACTVEEIAEKRERARLEKRPYRYDRTCRGEDVPADVPHTVRAALPTTGSTTVHDLLRGDVTYDHGELDDLIILRSDGSPTYNFTVVVDDSDMRITHVLRGDDHLNNTPKQICLYRLLGKPVPEFAHFPMIHGPDGGKLSKRHGATSVTEFRDMGYLPEAMVSYLVRLGWSHGDQEEFTLEELEEIFDLDNVGKTPGVFDVVKLDHVNGRFIRAARIDRLLALLRPFLEKLDLDPSVDWLPKAVRALQERSGDLHEMAEGLLPFYVEDVVFDERAKRKHLKPDRAALLPSLADRLEAVERFEAGALEESTRGWLTENGTELKRFGQTIRVALTGRSVSPPLFDTMEILGREKAVDRLRKAPAAAAAERENP